MKNKKIRILKKLFLYFILFTIVFPRPRTALATSSIDYNTVTYKKDNVEGTYIKLNNLSDEKKQKRINAMLKADAAAIVNGYDTKNKKAQFAMQTKVNIITKSNLCIVTYTVDYNNIENAYPTSYHYWSVIDLKSATRITYKNKSDLIKIKTALQNGSFTCETKDKELASAQKDYIKRLSSLNLDGMLKSINFQYRNGKILRPELFMYRINNIVYMSIPTIHALGDHIEIHMELGT